MSSHRRATCLLSAILGITMSSLALAWTPYISGPVDPDYRGGYLETSPPVSPTEPGILGPGLPPPDYPRGGYGNRWAFPPGTEVPQVPYGEVSPGAEPFEQGYPGYRPWLGPPHGHPGFSQRSFASPAGFRISRRASNDAYDMTIELDGMSPEEVQVRPQGNWILISRESSAQQVQNDSFDDGRGYMRSFSYSSGRTSRRVSVPRDGNLSAMSREDGESSIHIHIPRRGH
jgi:hypothetical protein